MEDAPALPPPPRPPPLRTEVVHPSQTTAMRSKIAKLQHAKARRVELAHARKRKVPFEESKKRRVEMHAALSDCSGLRGGHRLYMISRDGKTIRRVHKDGNMRPRDIVGPVKEPAAAGPSDLNAYCSASDSDSD